MPDAQRSVPVRFSATYSIAAQVAIDPSNCPDLQQANARTVQQAIDILCQREGMAEEPGFRIERMMWQNGDVYEHDGLTTLDAFMSGLRIICDDLVDPLTVKDRPVVYVSAMADVQDVMTREFRLTGELFAQDNEILWKPRQRSACGYAAGNESL